MPVPLSLVSVRVPTSPEIDPIASAPNLRTLRISFQRFHQKLLLLTRDEAIYEFSQNINSVHEAIWSYLGRIIIRLVIITAPGMLGCQSITPVFWI